MAHRTQTNGPLNSTLTVLKKMPDPQLTPRFTTRKPPPSVLNAKREISPVKLPTLLKRTTTTGTVRRANFAVDFLRSFFFSDETDSFGLHSRFIVNHHFVFLLDRSLDRSIVTRRLDE